MTIASAARERILTGLAQALDHVRPGATLIGEWFLEQKSSSEICGSPGTCWHHGVDSVLWPAMAAQAVKDGSSMYDFTECYADLRTIYFGQAEAEHSGETFRLRTHITHTASTPGGYDHYICTLWVEEGDDAVLTKWEAGPSAYHDPSEFHELELGDNEKKQPPPDEIRF